MNNPHDSGRPIDEGVPISNQFVVPQPETQTAIPFTELQLRRIKEEVKAIHSPESQWVAGASAAFGAGVSFIIGTISLSIQTEVPAWLISLFGVVSGAGFLMAITCGFGFLGSRRQRNNDISRIIQTIEDIQSSYPNPRQNVGK